MNVAANQPAYYDPATGALNLDWYQIQYYLRVVAPNASNTVIVSSADAKAGLPATIIPPDWLLETSSFMLAAPAALPEPKVSVQTQISEDGLTETTIKTTRTYNSESGDWDTEMVITAVTRVQAGETTTWVTTITTITTVFDLEIGDWRTITASVTTISGEPGEEPTTTPQPSPESSEDPAPEETEGPGLEGPAPEENQEPGETQTPAPESPAPEESQEPQETPEPPRETEESPAPEDSAPPSASPEPAEPEDSQEPENSREPEPEGEGQSETVGLLAMPKGWQSATARTAKFRRILSPGRPKLPGHPWGGGYATVWVRDTGQRAGPLEPNLLTRGGPLKSTLASSDAKWRITI